jgi:outer membrane protein OmpA-like peptidoglycan-associated protein
MKLSLHCVPKTVPNRLTLAGAVKIGALAGVVTLAGCASLPPHPELSALQTRYEIISGQPYAIQKAEDELAETREALALGNSAYKDDDDEELAHYIFVADKNLDIAEARIELSETQDQIASATEVRERTLLEARELDVALSEAEVREAEAEARDAELDAARTGLALSAQQEQLADREAEIRAQERELERKDAELAATEAELTAAEREARLLANELDEVSVVENERGTVLVLSDIVFDLDSADIKPGSERALDQIAEFLIDEDVSRVKVEGHTDALGPDNYNESLSYERADAVRDALVARGVPRDRITMAGYGEDYPVASNDTASGRQLNRRVEIVLNDRVGRPISSR